MNIQSISSSIYSSSFGWKYDVFLSFRGEDIRTSFLDHLYHALKEQGINVFKDDKILVYGEDITSGLVKAIEESRFIIVIFSKNYAYSTWCLDELIEIVECKSTSDREVIFPIFYKVDPSEVRKQTGNFQEAFAKHEEDFWDNVKKVQKWRIALRKVANIKGWDSKNRHEVELIQEIVNEISSKLKHVASWVSDLEGINSRLETLMSLLNIKSDDVLMIGICGMGGLGKTTIARVIYDSISDQFERSSFLDNVREISETKGLTTLQIQLLSELLTQKDSSIWNIYDGINMIGSRLRCKKVLIVIDDVVNKGELDNLVGKRDWFGSGSRIIITSRDEGLLRSHKVNEVYKLEKLNEDEAFRLFCMKAFGIRKPLKEYGRLSKCFIKYADGLPLALKILGSFLCGRTVDEWKSALQRLRKNSEKDILDKLQISFDGLKEIEKNIFLDIACFFKGQDRNYVIKILDGCDFDPIIGISVLIDKSLITILNNNVVWMHDLLQEMGQQIVRKQSTNELGKCSRLWKVEDVCHVLTKNTGSEAVEGIILEHYSEESFSLEANGYFSPIIASAKVFSKMTNLRLLKIYNVQIPEGFDDFPQELRLIEWHEYPSTSFPSSLQIEKVVELSLPYSCIKQLWTGMKVLNKLKFMRLEHSYNLIATPDFTCIPNLEELNLEECVSLCMIHPSLLVHQKLLFMNLKGCTSLTILPSKIAMESVRKLILSNCYKLKIFPEIVGSMENLSELLLDGTAIRELPFTIERLSGLAVLDLKDCQSLESLPSAIKSFKSLKTLNMSGCSKIENVPEALWQVESLEALDLSRTAVQQPTLSNSFTKILKRLLFRGYRGPSSSTSQLPQLVKNLDSLVLTLPSSLGLCCLKELDLSDCNIGEGAIPTAIWNLLSLEELNLSKNNFISLPGSISKLRYLYLEDCKMLQLLPELPSNTRKVRVDGCDSLETLSSAFKLCMSQELSINCNNCFKLHSQKSFAFLMLKEILEAEWNQRTRIDIVAPGSNVPEWFSHKKEGSSIRIGSPPNSHNKLVGYAVCIVFGSSHFGIAEGNAFWFRSHSLFLQVKAGVAESHRSSVVGFTDFHETSEGFVKDHLWLLYLSCEEHLDTLFDGHPNDGGHIEFSVLSYSAPRVGAKRFGIHPVYEHEVEEFNQKRIPRRFLGSRNYVATTSKQKLTDNAEAEASASGHAEDEDPIAKRFGELE